MNFKRFSWVITAVGLLLSVTALWWWQDFYGQVAERTGATVDEYLECLYRDGGLCDVIAVTGEFFGMSAYDPNLFRVGAALFVLGLILRLSAR